MGKVQNPNSIAHRIFSIERATDLKPRGLSWSNIRLTTRKSLKKVGVKFDHSHIPLAKFQPCNFMNRRVGQ